MERVELEPVKSVARKKPGEPGAWAILPGGLELRVFGEMEEGDPNPLSLVSTALSACEAIMFDMIASKLKASYEGVTVEAELEFELGSGVRSARIVYTIKGMDEASARRVVELVKRYCPVYRTLERAGAVLVDEVRVS